MIFEQTERERGAGLVTRARNVGLAIALALSAGGCTRFENAMAAVPVFSYLRNSPSIDPYEMPRDPPPGALAYLSPAGDSPVGIVATEAGLTAFGATAKNPLSPTDTAALNHGKVMFDRYCFVCHGLEGKGDGPILNKQGEQGKFPYAPNLTLPVTAGRTDGYLYGIIDVGRGLMPPYGPRMNDKERWAIVLHLRELQRAAGAVPAAPAPAQAPGR